MHNLLQGNLNNFTTLEKNKGITKKYCEDAKEIIKMIAMMRKRD